MASPQRVSLERSMNQLRRELTDDQEKEISGANRKAINHEIQKMQGKLGREKSLCRLSRIESFLDAMEQIEKLVTIFLSVSEAVAFIWGPIKLVLMAAMAWTNCIKKLLDVYEEVADTLDNLTLFRALIKSDERFNRMVEDYFSDILRFHHCILNFFSRPDWKAKFQWVWGDFRRKIKPIIESLKRKQAMLSDDKLQPHAILKAIEDFDTYGRDQFKQINAGLECIADSEEIKNQRVQEQEIRLFLERKLNVSLPQITSQLEVTDTVISSSGSWIFLDPLFHFWETNTSPQGCVLFLTGCPGAGKSTLARTITQYLNKKLSQQPSSRGSLIYFFFKYNNADRRSTRSMLCHIITQIINTDESMMRFAYDKCSSIDYLDLPVLKSLALDCLSSKRDTTIVLDGLDEGSESEPERAIKWCLDELLPTIFSRGCHIRVLICGQEDGRIEPLLSPYPQIRLHTKSFHRVDIQEYCKTKASAIATRFRLPPDDEKALILKVTEASNGMFLYTKVVMANLLSMGSKKEFKSELASNQFPRNLDEAYGRIVQRVINAAEPSAQVSAKKILGLLVCSARPLRWREIQSRFCINADEETCDPDDLRADTCKQLCSSLVDTTDCEIFPGVQSEQTITMIHETASKYVVHIGVINTMEEHVAMSLFCCRYLSSGPLLGAERSIDTDVLKAGYYSFMDYAAVYYRSHIQKAEPFTGDIVSALGVERAKKALSHLEEVHCSRGSGQVVGGSPSDGISTTLDLAIQDRVFAIRMVIDKQRPSLSESPGFQDLEGPKRYKCWRVQCGKFTVGYPSEAALQRHVASHERPFRCIHESCFAHILGCQSKERLQCHINAFHDESSSKIRFPTGRGADRSDKSTFIDACKAGDLNNVMSLHLQGADIIGYSYETFPLKVALKAGHGHICKYLIDNGANPLETNRGSSPYKSSPLHLAVKRKDLQLLGLFLLGYQDLVTNSTVPLLSSCVLDIFSNFPPAVELLLQLLETSHFARHSHLLQRIMAQQLVTLFRTWGREVTTFSDGQTVVRHSTDATTLHKRFCKVFPKLYDQNGKLSLNPNRQEYQIYQRTFKLHNQLLHDAFVAKQYPLAAFLMDVDIENVLQAQDNLGNMPLNLLTLVACLTPCSGCIIMAERLAKLDDGRLSNVPNNKGKLPVHVAVERDLPPALLRVVIDCAGNLNHNDKVGTSPLHYVRSERALSVLLQQKDVDIFSRNQKGQTVFSVMCDGTKGLKEDMIRSLLIADKRLAWTADDSSQRLTPLHHAMAVKVFHRFQDVAALLLQLPEVEQVLQGFLVVSTKGSMAVRKFARDNHIEQALEAMDRIEFGLPLSD